MYFVKQRFPTNFLKKQLDTFDSHGSGVNLNTASLTPKVIEPACHRSCHLKLDNPTMALGGGGGGGGGGLQ